MERFAIFRSFLWAFQGLRELRVHQCNAKLMSIMAAGVIVLVLQLHASVLEIMFLIFSIGLVFVTEIFNTVLEMVTNLINEDYNPRSKVIKDIIGGRCSWQF